MTEFLPHCERLTQSEVVAELKLWRKRGDVAARNRILMSVAPMAWSMALKMTRHDGTKAKESFNEAIALLAEKFDMYSEKRGAFTTWAYSWIFNAITTYHRNHRCVIKTPFYRDQRVHDVDTVNIKSINHMDRDGKEFTSIASSDIEPGDEVGEAEEIEGRRRVLKHSLSKVPHRLRNILERRAQGHKLLEIGNDLKISKERVRQLERVALVLLREHASGMMPDRVDA